MPTASLEAEPPLLFFKVGALGAAPLDFPKALSEEFHTKFVSSDRVRNEALSLQNEKLTGRRLSRFVSTTLSQRIQEALMSDPGDTSGDVVADIFYNSELTRNKGPIKIAQAAGALTVALNIITPPKLIETRVKTWTRLGSFEVPIEDWDVLPIVAARGMMQHVIRPQPHETLDYIFELDGDTGTDGLIKQVDDLLVENGLLEADE